MRYQISGKQIDVGEALQTHVKAELGEVVEKYAQRPTECVVVFSRVAHEFVCEAVIHLSTGLTAQAKGHAAEIYAAFESCREKLDKQLRRYKRRIRNHHSNRSGPVEFGGASSYILAATEDADEVRLNWRIFGNSNLRRLDKRIVTERFSMASEITLPARYPMPVKTLFRTDSFQLPGSHMPKRPATGGRIIRNGSGRLIEDVTVRGFQVTDPEPYGLAQINHYMVKDSDSFLMKSARGSSAPPDREIALDYWKKRNVNREEDLTLVSLSDAIRDEMEALNRASGGLLGRLRNRSLRMWREQIFSIKTRPEMRGLWEQLV